MKLVDILARELNEWPDDYLVETITQDVDCMVFGWSEADPEMDEGYWVFSERSKLTDWRPGEFAMAEDRNNALVTRAQWQAAVDALKAGEQAWDGEGLPPVGVCEFQHHNAPNGVWHPTSIRYSSHAHVIYVDNIDNSEQCFTVSDPCKIDFRPIRTAEQIAAEKECAEIKEIAIATGLRAGAGQMEVARALYKAGYRKQVQP